MIIVDGSNLLHRILNTSQADLMDSNFNFTGGVHGFLSSLAGLCEKRGLQEAVVVAWDLGVPVFRRRLFQDYKPHKTLIGIQDVKLFSNQNLSQAMISGREVIVDEHLQKYIKSRDLLHQHILPLTGTISVQTVNAEADDIIAAWIRYVRHEDVTILSSDQDLFQLLSANVKVYDGRINCEYDIKSFPIDKELDPVDWRLEFLLRKAISGDHSDGIPGVESVGEINGKRYARQIVALLREANFRELSEENLATVLLKLTRPNGGRKDGFERIKTAATFILRNFKLVDLEYPFLKNDPMIDDIRRSFMRTVLNKVNPDRLDELLDSYLMRKAKLDSESIIESNRYDDLSPCLKRFL